MFERKPKFRIGIPGEWILGGIEFGERIHNAESLLPHPIGLIDQFQRGAHLLDGVRVPAEVKFRDRTQSRNRDRSTQAPLWTRSHPDRAQRRDVARIERGEVASDPTRGGPAFVIDAALHQLHGFEMAVRFVRRAAGMDNGKMFFPPGVH